jgi:hypothetical protein
MIGDPPPTEGQHFISMEGGSGLGEGFSLTLCQGITLVPGSEYCITVDLITWTNDGFVCPPFSLNGCPGVSRLLVYGSSGPCESTQTLWTSPALTGTWTEYSFCFVPTGNWNVLSFRLFNPTFNFSAVAMDNMSITRTDGEFLDDCEILEVEWLDADVSCDGDGRRVSWTVISDEPTLHFVVERSADLMNWTAVGELHADGGNGASLTYSLLDGSVDHPLDEGVLYYRVVSLDALGSASYSEVVSSQCSFILFPNPADDHITVRVTEQDAIVRVIDATGRLVHVQQVSGFETTISLAAFAPGYYAVQVVHTGVLLAHGVFIKT